MKPRWILGGSNLGVWDGGNPGKGKEGFLIPAEEAR
jgi:hypothetical protein